MQTLTQPRYLHVPPRWGSSGPDAIELARSIGILLDPEQELVLDAVLSTHEDASRRAALEAAVIEPRQNGKTMSLEVVALDALFVQPDVELVLWTSHRFRTTKEAFRDCDEMIAGAPHLAREVRRVAHGNDDKSIELRNGRRLSFIARSRVSGRGLTGDVVILDEAFALTADQIGSLIPTLSARPNPLIVYASSAGLVSSDILRRIRDRGRAGNDPSLVYLEWCADDGDCGTSRCEHRPGTPGCVLDDEERWRQANPALGRRITIEFLRAERRALPPEEFARERLGWWDEPASGLVVIPSDVWQDCADRDAEITEPCTLAIDVAPGHASAAIVACGGALHVADHHRGTGWVIDRLRELVADHQVSAVGLDPAGPAAALIPDLEAAGFETRSAQNPDGLLVLLSGRESVQACEMFLAAVLDHTLMHRDQHVLNTAVQGAGRRQVGDSWRWSRRDSTVDISPLVAATIAWLLATRTPDDADLLSSVW